LPEEVGIVDDGSEEIEGLNECGFVVDFVHSCVIGTGRTDEKIRVVDVGETTQDLREFGLAEFRRSSSAGGQFSKSWHSDRMAWIGYFWKGELLVER